MSADPLARILAHASDRCIRVVTPRSNERVLSVAVHPARDARVLITYGAGPTLGSGGRPCESGIRTVTVVRDARSGRWQLTGRVTWQSLGAGARDTSSRVGMPSTALHLDGPDALSPHHGTQTAMASKHTGDDVTAQLAREHITGSRDRLPIETPGERSARQARVVAQEVLDARAGI